MTGETLFDELAGEERRQRWEEVAEIPLTLAAFGFLAAYAWPILEPSIRDTPAGTACPWITSLTWAAFAVDYLVRLALSRRRAIFVRRNLLDLARRRAPGAAPAAAAPADHGAQGPQPARRRLAPRDASRSTWPPRPRWWCSSRRWRCWRPSDRQRAPNVRTFGDAVWWALTTITTVGYGDHYPVTLTGRFVAGGLMVAGIALLGVVTASIASWLIERVAEVEEESSAATRHDVMVLADEVARLREEISRLRTGDDT